MAITLKGSCRVMGLREGTPERHGSLAVWRHVGRESGAAAISLRVLEVTDGISPGLRHGPAHEVLYVLDGQGLVYVDGVAAPVEPDTGVFVPPYACVTLEARGGAPLTLVSVQCPDPGPKPNVIAPLVRPAREGVAIPRVARLGESEARPVGDRWYRVLIDDKVGSTEVTQFVGAIPPGRAPDHYHEYEEVLCFLAGYGRIWADGISAPIGPGQCAFLPRRQVHCTENLGPGELRLLGVFYPAGSPAVSYSSES
jgi:mannose-6-phosphate isomerase-like protein (cupin superfamily)